MITYSDCLVLLTNLSDNGIDCTAQIKELSKGTQVDLSILKFINDNRELDLTKFYEKLRKSYNNKKSNLYINIMRGSEDPLSVLTTLNAYALQITIFSKSVSDKPSFYKFARLDDVYKCLYHYSKTYDLIPCIKLVNLIKADIKTLETIYRDNQDK